jgi:recombinational DNA repair ATPase RecF
MKILNLHVKNIRGSRDIQINPQGESFVIYGPNGTGKSAVVDALDFLFTGRISRLSGEGTLGITLREHGPHIDTKPKDTLVEATVEIPDSKNAITLKRCISNPSKLEVAGSDDFKLPEVLNIAARGQHVLSRRHILKYVAAQRGERAKEIQALLNLSNVEQWRELFVSVENEASRQFESSKEQMRSAQMGLYVPFSLKEFSHEKLIEKVNELRAVLHGKPIVILDRLKIKEGLEPPDKSFRTADVSLKTAESNAQRALDIIANESAQIIGQENSLLDQLTRLKSDKKLKHELNNLQLLNLGISLLDETGRCPLCETQWKPDELREKLESRLLSAREAQNIQKGINQSLDIIKFKYLELKNSVSTSLKFLGFVGLKQYHGILGRWITQLESHLRYMDDPETNLEAVSKDRGRLGLFAPENYKDIFIATKERVIEESNKLSPELRTWDTLTGLETALQTLEREENHFKKAQRLYNRASLIKSAYENAKDNVLNTLYSKIQTDFVSYYKLLHGEDEKEFEAVLQSRGPELLFEVDFHGRGKFPPLALHSEGHQDSMGLCLYLALAKLLSEDKVLLIILDDVVMSIDSGHRRFFSRLLRTKFPNRQFLITTHNRTWARQLQTDGVVKGRNVIEFASWSLETGPILGRESEFWRQIYGCIKSNDISTAAGKLRENSEYYFNEVCDKLRARTIHRLDERYELGDLLLPAISRYKELLRIAKQSANSWGRKEDVEKLGEIESIANEIINRSQVEQWGINPNVHFSRWTDFTKDDFQPIVEAFQDLFTLFHCPKCNEILYVVHTDGKDQNLKCSCGDVNWNLVLRKK